MKPAEATPTDHAGCYWDAVAAAWDGPTYPLWRLQSDLVHGMLVERWLPPEGLDRVLKTDLFDEHVGEGLYPVLRRRARRVTSVDVSPAVVDSACARYPELDAVVADVRRLPFESGTFDAVVSNSTLDHFESRDQVVDALHELARVMRPDARLVLTLDNALNPLVALRNALPAAMARSLRRVEYGIGWTCGPDGMRRLLFEAGLQVHEVTAVLHVPRILVAELGHRIGARIVRRPVLAALRKGERLERWPTRALTGHYVAALAVPSRPTGPARSIRT